MDRLVNCLCHEIHLLHQLFTSSVGDNELRRRLLVSVLERQATQLEVRRLGP
jgi:hypothetical protein